METGSIQAKPTDLPTSGLSQQAERAEQAQSNSQAPASDNLLAGTAVPENGETTQISDDALRFAATAADNRATASEVESNEEAQEIINQLSESIQGNPNQAGAAQSNLTSNVVRNLLG